MRFNSTKRRIILSLNERNKTLSELSRELGLTKSSIYQHLLDLQRMNLVSRLPKRNKFVYYKLTKKGKDILDLLISVVVASLSSVITYLGIDDYASKHTIAADSGPINISTNIYVAVGLSFIFVFIAVFFFLKIPRTPHS